jgi:hypothetical protein
VLLESENEDNDIEVRNYYKEIYEDLMATVQEKKPALHETIESAIEFRTRLLNLSNFIKSRPVKVDKKKAIL